jgi:GxxExxY protein
MQTNSHEDTNNNEKILEKDLCFKIVGAVMDVSNKYGKGFKEIIFQKALVEQLESLGFKVEQQKRINIYSLNTGKLLGTYVPDVIVEDKVVLELKATNYIIEQDVVQQRSYLKASKYEIGYLINFGTPKLFIQRSIYTNDRKPFLAKLSHS